jgi:hypothetical protein
MLLKIKLRQELSQIFDSNGISPSPSKDSGTFSSWIYYQCVRTMLPFMEESGADLNHAAGMSPMISLAIYKARKNNIDKEITYKDIIEYSVDEKFYAEDADSEVQNLLETYSRVFKGTNPIVEILEGFSPEIWEVLGVEDLANSQDLLKVINRE